MITEISFKGEYGTYEIYYDFVGCALVKRVY